MIHYRFLFQVFFKAAIVASLLFMLFLLLIETDKFKQLTMVSPNTKTNETVLQSRLVYAELNKTRVKKYILYWQKQPSNDTGQFNKNCVFTSNRNLLKNVHDFDAIRFEYELTGSEVRKIPRPATRSPHQMYMMCAMESSIRLKNRGGFNFEDEHDFYNVTMTYRLDSDILWNYGECKDLETNRIIAPALQVNWRVPDDNFSDPEMLQAAKNKKVTAVWIVSNCDDDNTPSRRNGLVKKLHLSTDIEVYGNCGGYQKCPLKSTTVNRECISYDNYRFYLAFENTLCSDYITEKAFKVMNENIIPVVFNGCDNSRFLPPKSYIDANAFKTTEDLVNHLKFLSNNPEEYIKYFWWKKYYTFRHRYYTHDHERICDLLNAPATHSKTQKYDNMTDWFTTGCIEPKIQF